MIDDETLLILWDGARQRDPTCEGALLQALAPMVRRIIGARVRRLRPPDDFVEDVTQEALLRLFRGWQTARAAHPAQIVQWVTAVTRRAVVDELRASSTRILFGSRLLEEDLLSDSAIHSAADDDVEPGYALLCRLTVECQRALPASTATLLWYRVIEGATLEELGAHLRISADAAKRRLQRGQATLRREVLSCAASLPEPERSAVALVIERLGLLDETPKR